MHEGVSSFRPEEGWKGKGKSHQLQQSRMRGEYCVAGIQDPNTQSIQSSNRIRKYAEKGKCGEALSWTLHMLSFVAKGPRYADHVTGKRL